MSLRIWLPLDGNLENKGCGRFRVTGNNLTPAEGGKTGRCMTFNGTDSWIRLDPAPLGNGTTAFSFACRIRPANFTNGSRCLFSNRSVANSSGFMFMLSNSANYQYLFDSGARWTFEHPLPAIDEWIHVAVTYRRNGEKRLYLNGTLIESTTTGTSPSGAGAAYGFIGASQGGNGSTPTAYYYQGDMCDVRIYDHELGPAEVRETARGLIRHYRLDGAGNSGDRVTDESGYGGHGRITGGLASASGAPRYAGAAAFDGTGYITAPSTTAEARAASFWIKTAFPSQNEVVWADYRSHMAFGFSAYGDVIPWTWPSSSVTKSTQSRSGMTANAWNHVVVQYDENGTDMEMYVNGVKAAAAAGRQSYFGHTSDCLMSGRRYADSYKWGGGEMCDFRMYAERLSADEIRALYSVGATAGKDGRVRAFSLEEGSGNAHVTKTGRLRAVELEEDGGVAVGRDGSVHAGAFAEI